MAKGQRKEKKIKILFWGDAVIETGFARVLHSIAENLPDSFDIAWIGVNYHGDPHAYKKFRIYPATLGGDIYGVNRFNAIAEYEKPDIIFIINDAWVQDSLLKVIKEFYKDKQLPKIVSYVPVDAENHDPDWYRNFDIVSDPVAYTNFGYSEILKAAPHLQDRLSIIPHGISNKDFHKLAGSKVDIKKKLYGNKLEYYDSFIVLNANRNQPRKKIDITMEAFSLFAKDKPSNVKLYLHMGIVDAHINLEKYARRLGILPRLLLTSPKAGVQSVSRERLNLIYNATDVGLNTGVGEGWGLCNIEHAVTGAPQVVGNHSSLKEIYYDCGVLVDPVEKITLENIMTTGRLLKAEDVALSLERLYKEKEFYSELSERSVKKFTAVDFTWKKITEYWVQIFMR